MLVFIKKIYYIRRLKKANMLYCSKSPFAILCKGSCGKAVRWKLLGLGGKGIFYRFLNNCINWYSQVKRHSNLEVLITDVSRCWRMLIYVAGKSGFTLPCVGCWPGEPVRACCSLQGAGYGVLAAWLIYVLSQSKIGNNFVRISCRLYNKVATNKFEGKITGFSESFFTKELCI